MRKLKGFVRLMRPSQWFKSLFILIGGAPALLLMGFQPLTILVLSFIGVLDMILVQGVVYALNDISDLDSDKKHPVKRLRPIPSGALSVLEAKFFALALFVFSSVLAYTININLLKVNLALILVNILYSQRPFRFKDVPVLDFFWIGLAFPLRVAAGWYLFEPFNKAGFSFDFVVSKTLVSGSSILDLLLKAPSRVYDVSASFSTVTIAFVTMVLSTYFLAVFLLVAKRWGERKSFGLKAKLFRRVQKDYGEYQMRMYTILSGIASVFFMGLLMWSL
ncbi:MAG: UbiA family prenyltransferase, partial [Nanoarchaeota archaeon]|nr:UbiA family prenyltransferase [Nanoarchaeota archaeon]